MTTENASPFGTPNYERPQSNTTKFKKRKTLKVGSNRYRIMPPVHSLAASGQVFYWAAMEYGYCRTNPKDADKPIMVPSKCILRTTKRNGELEILQECPECSLRYAKKQELEALEVQLKSEGKTKQEIDDLTEPLRGWLKAHNKDSKYYLNVMSETGEFELLAISGKCKAALDNLITEIKAKYKLDPCSIEGGVWIDFVRTVPPGQGLAQCTDTPKPVMVQTTTAEGDIIERIKKAPLTPDQLEQAAKECVDIPKMFTEITYAQKKALAECSGDPAEVDAILNLTQKATSTETPAVKVAPKTTKVPPIEGIIEEKDVVETVTNQVESRGIPTPKAPTKTAPIAKAAPKAPAKSFEDIFGDDE